MRIQIIFVFNFRISYARLARGQVFNGCTSDAILKAKKVADNLGEAEVLWRLELASEFFRDFFAHEFGREGPDSAFSTRTKFKKEHGRDR